MRERSGSRHRDTDAMVAGRAEPRASPQWPEFRQAQHRPMVEATARSSRQRALGVSSAGRSEEHTSELQSLRHLVCRLLLEKKKKQQKEKLREIRERRRSVKTSCAGTIRTR